jgi:hypothetical protein
VVRRKTYLIFYPPAGLIDEAPRNQIFSRLSGINAIYCNNNIKDRFETTSNPCIYPQIRSMTY